MTITASFTLGIDSLLAEHADLLRGQRVGLVSHAAAVDKTGVTSAEKLVRSPGVNLTALFGPEHGFAGRAAAGETTTDTRHADWNLPIYSLYGDTRKPTPAMLDTVDTLIVEFQDLGARPYTYVSTLRLVLEAAAQAGKPVIIADRPVPLPRGCDGPIMDPAFETFVGLIPAPMQYGMTPGETAQWLADVLGLDIDLTVARMRGYPRDTTPQPEWPPWVPPSPRIRSWDAACTFTTTVFGEALPSLDYGSGAEFPFQVLGAPWLDATQLLGLLPPGSLPGLLLQPIRYTAKSGLHAGAVLDGVRLAIADYAAFRPVSAGVLLLDAIGRLHGIAALWEAPGTRPDWFDKLFGTDTVRNALMAGMPACDIIAGWRGGQAAFAASRDKHLLYSHEGSRP